MKVPRVSFDFDDTLEYKYVQDYAKELVERGIEVWIVTTRYEDVSRYSFECSHDKLYEAANYIGISNDHIHFNNMEYKYLFFEKEDFIFHLDDNYRELSLMRDLNTVGVLLDRNWIEKCNELLK